jgi:4-amino-4-deoxy-L-arabinose transferase-like glycosyltransferase
MLFAEPAVSRPLIRSYFGLAVAILAAVTIIRLIGLRFSVVDLFYDEAQYWVWSREPAFGYFSKPPLLAWIIAGAERVCGSSEACIRAPAPLLYFGTSLLVYALAETLYDARIAFWSAINVGLAAGVAFSSRIISTDVPLLFCWALALLAYVKLLRGGGYAWVVVLGLAFGFGLLAKYAMIYFILGIALTAATHDEARALLRRPALWLALAIAVTVIIPNIAWNYSNGFATFRHTGENIHGDGARFNPAGAIEFIVSQFAVFGPVLFAVFLLAVVRWRTLATKGPERLLLAFSVPTLALITLTALITRANANWAAPAFIAAAILSTALLVRAQAWRWLATSVAIGVVVQGLLLVGDAVADRLSLPLLSNPDVYHRTMGWRALGAATGRIAATTGAATIVSEQRDDVASLLYYLRDTGRVVLAWPSGPVPTHHFELTRALTASAAEPLLLVSRCPTAPRLAQYYGSVEPLGHIYAPTGPHTGRIYFTFKLSGVRGPIGALGACR